MLFLIYWHFIIGQSKHIVGIAYSYIVGNMFLKCGIFLVLYKAKENFYIPFIKEIGRAHV